MLCCLQVKHSLGTKGITWQLLKPLGVIGLSCLTCLCDIAWKLGLLSLDLQTGVAIFLFKKEGWTVCSKFSCIPLFSLPGMVYGRVPESRVYPLVEPCIQQDQYSYRPSCGTLNQLSIFLRVLKGMWKFTQQI